MSAMNSNSTKYSGIDINLLTLASTTFVPDFFDSNEALSFAAVYGNDGSNYSENLQVWASRLNFSLEAPSANSSGMIHYGMLPLSSFISD